jgi:hypothetical protein
LTVLWEYVIVLADEKSFSSFLFSSALATLSEAKLGFTETPN